MAILGCIADDFTGGGDAASFLVKGGMSVRFYNGIPNEKKKDMGKYGKEEAIVIALKSRMKKPEEAIEDSIAAARFLINEGVQQIYFKYCSTFDSTREGNIGPVADALMEFMKVPYTILCPALPINGRTVENGQIMVNGVPLNQSSMKDHPLTPMWDSRIAELMRGQSKYSCFSVNLNQNIMEDMKKKEAKPYYLIPDYRTWNDGEKIADLFGNLPLLTGGSGLLEHLARYWMKGGQENSRIPKSQTVGRALLLAGSCSKTTLSQINKYKETGGSAYKVKPLEVIDGKQNLENIWNWIMEYSHENESVLVYSSDSPEKVRVYQERGRKRVSELLENIMAELAARAVANGFTRLICAGGETSGAIIEKLGYSSYLVGESVVPGVPVMVPVEQPDIRIVLKSGNFGKEDFFEKALFVTSDTDYTLECKKKEAVWAARSLFERGKVSGSSANMSFRHGEYVYITKTGACFGNLKEEDFAILDIHGTLLSEERPSKEWPLHIMLYKKSEEIGAIIHTHSFYSVLWSFVQPDMEEDCIPSYTPYLKLKLGSVGMIPYEKPGSEVLFSVFKERLENSDGYLLRQHGPIVPGKTIQEAFDCLEELEESAHVAWELRKIGFGV